MQLLGQRVRLAAGARSQGLQRRLPGPILRQAFNVDLGTVTSIVGDVVSNESDATEGLRSVRAVSYVSRRRLDDDDFDPDAVDEEGLPLVYNEQRIAAFWSTRPGELAGRWAKFAGIAVPWLTKLANAFISGQLENRQRELAADAVDNMERLGPTFLKLAQILSIRPDVLPPPVMAELSRVQDKIAPFSTDEARAMIEKELGAPVDELFSEFSAEPVGAASLAQVYRARVRATGQEVAVKVQRPGALSTISKDLYVMRRAVGVYERIVKRFTAQTTDYQQLLSTFAEGLYTELDFRNEALNASRMRELLDASDSGTGARVVIPAPVLDLTARRVLTMEWVTGVKLTTLPAEEIRTLVGVGQEAFLVQLLEVGFIHGDPHPGNLLKVTEGPDAGKLALLDFGLVAEVPARDRAAMISATIHLGNRDWDALIDDFIALEFLPPGCDRGLIIPVMERVLGPYLRGGGARSFNFQALSQDLLSATLEIPFSVPPYMSLLARAVATLEGIALLGDPGYQMVAQAYPFVARRVLRNDSSGAGALLRDMLYDSKGNLRPARLSALLQAALGYVAEKSEGFVDLDSLPEDGASVSEVLRFVLSPEAQDLRPLLVTWLATGADLLLRDRTRKALAAAPALAPRLPLLGPLPLPPAPPIPVPGLGLLPINEAADKLLPPLDPQESVYLQSLVELAAGVLGVPAAQLDSPDPSTLINLLTRPGDQARELASALAAVAGDPSAGGAAAGVAADVADAVAEMLAARAGVPVDTLFPLRAPVLSRVRAQLPTPAASPRTSRNSSPVSSLDEDGGASSSSDASGGGGTRVVRVIAPAPPPAVAAAAAAAANGSRASSGKGAVVMRSLSSMDEEQQDSSSGAGAAAREAAAPVRR